MLSIVTSTITAAQEVGHSNIPTLGASEGAEPLIVSYEMTVLRLERLELALGILGQSDRNASRDLRIIAQQR